MLLQPDFDYLNHEMRSRLAEVVAWSRAAQRLQPASYSISVSIAPTCGRIRIGAKSIAKRSSVKTSACLRCVERAVHAVHKHHLAYESSRSGSTVSPNEYNFFFRKRPKTGWARAGGPPAPPQAIKAPPKNMGSGPVEGGVRTGIHPVLKVTIRCFGTFSIILR